MKPRNKDHKNTHVNQGLSPQDQNYLRKFDNAEADPEIQMFTEELGDEIAYFCSICKSRLDYLEETKTIWICSNCSQTYDTCIQDAPLRDISSTRVKAYSEFQYYPKYDESDPDMIFADGIDLSGVQDSTPGNVLYPIE